MPESAYAIALVPGDGIGREVVPCARAVLETVQELRGRPSFTFSEHVGGYDAWAACGQALPDATLEAARAADGVLVGATDSARLPPGVPKFSRSLRRGLEVSVSLRPVRSFTGVPATMADLDVLVVREVSQGFYSGVEYHAGEDAACAVRIVTRDASTRAARVAFEQARQRRGKVTTVHKVSALPVSDRLFLESVATAAEDFPDVAHETRNVDTCAFELAHLSGRYDVLLATNAYGDILSDLAAGLSGGLGLVPSGCVGRRGAYFEPIHGTAPDIAGSGVANPVASILSAAMMLRHLGEADAAGLVEQAVATTLARGRHLTPDLGGKASTGELQDAVIEELDRQA